MLVHLADPWIPACAGMTELPAETMTAAPDSPLATLWCPVAESRAAAQRASSRTCCSCTTPAWSSAEAALDWLTRQESGVSCHYLVDEEGRIAQIVAGVRARLARRPEPVGRRDRPQFLLDRHRDPQSRPRFRLSGFSRRRDAGGRGAVPRHPEPPRHSAAARARSFRRGAGPEARPRREIRLGSVLRAPASGFGCRPRRSRTMPA